MKNLSVWEPMREMMTLRQAMDRLFDEAVTSSRLWPGEGEAHTLPLEVYATDNEIVVRAAVPGLKPDQVDIRLEGDTLVLQGEFPPRLENVTYLFCERPTGQFVRTLRLNVPVDVNKAEAVFEHGLLTLTLPKAEAVRPRAIPIKVK